MKELREMARQSKLDFVAAAFRGGMELKKISVLAGLSTNKIKRYLKRLNVYKDKSDLWLAEVGKNGCNGKSKRATQPPAYDP
jgi:hypothetical protein